MDLFEWLEKEYGTIKNGAIALDYCENHFYSIKMKRFKMGRKLARKIEKASDGAFKAEDLLKEYGRPILPKIPKKYRDIAQKIEEKSKGKVKGSKVLEWLKDEF